MAKYIFINAIKIKKTYMLEGHHGILFDPASFNVHITISLGQLYWVIYAGHRMLCQGLLTEGKG